MRLVWKKDKVAIVNPPPKGGGPASVQQSDLPVKRIGKWPPMELQPQPGAGQGGGSPAGKAKKLGELPGKVKEYPIPKGFDEHKMSPGATKELVKDPEKAEMNEGTKPGEWQERVVKGVQLAQSKGKGLGHGALGRMMQNAYKPVVNWRQVLRQFISGMKGQDWSWEKPSRGAAMQGIYLPTLKPSVPAIDDLIIAVDTSGSVGTRTFDQFISEIAQSFKVFRMSARIVWWDGIAIEGVKIDSSTAQQELKRVQPAGGGGTEMSSVYDLIMKKRWRPKGIIYFTDGGVEAHPRLYGPPGKNLIVLFPYDNENLRKYAKCVFIDPGTVDVGEADDL